MHSAQQKVKDMGSAAKEKAHVTQAKLEEEAGKAGARTMEGREIAEENRKMKEAEANAELHASKARHVDEKQQSHHIPGVAGHHHYPPAAGPTGGYNNY